VLAAGLADGRIVVHDLARGTSSELVATSAPSAVFVTGDGIASQHGRTVELRGRATYSVTLPRGAVVRDADGLRVLFTVGERVKELDLAKGRTRNVAVGQHAQREGSSVATATGRVVRVVVP
jgi:hypothetical protein